MMRFFTSALFSLLTLAAFSQKPVFQGTKVKAADFQALTTQFYAFEVFQLDVNALDQFVKSAGNVAEFTLQFGSEHNWDIWLTPHDVRSPKYQVRVQTDKGVETLPGKPEIISFRGLLASPGGEGVSLTIDEDFLYGFVEKGDEDYFIEPLWYFVPGQPKDRFVVYAASQVKPSGGTCALIERDKNQPSKAPEHDKEIIPNGTAKVGQCYQLDLAIASDKLMFNKYGSVTAVENHNIGVIANVQANYDNEFADEIYIYITEQFVVTGTDPWTNSTDAGVLLNSFTNWAPNGFNNDHDMGELWTNRDLNGGVVGIAWLSSVCTPDQYHVVQDWTSNGQLLREMTAHEMGHNWSATHDPAGSPHIMAPVVQNSDTWSAQSISQINSYIANVAAPPNGCLGFCPTSQPPVADFSVTPSVGCSPLTVTYNDESANAPSSWEWEFPGGTPSTSTLQNPTVTYGAPGVYAATLTVSNPLGEHSYTDPAAVTVNEAPLAGFTSTQTDLTVNFTNTSSASATSFFWEFGDTYTSMEQNPSHTYTTEGFYFVTLTATNSCGSSFATTTIAVFTPPSASFLADPVSGCASLQVQYINTSSSNAVDYAWNFPGGNPSFSSAQHPTVVYASAGTYSVTLTVTNPAGTSTATQTNYILVQAQATAGFTSSVSGSTATFTNTSSNATSYLWNFGDGTTSTVANPVHTYSSNGTFTVTLTATNFCSSATITHTVTIALPPTASFTASPTSGCAPLAVQFTNTSSANSSSFSWQFPGGSPASSSAQNPSTTYSTAGTYTVTLTATNSAGSSTATQTITVNALPTAGFNFSVSGTTANFTNSSANAASYLWNFGDGSTSTLTNPSHTYAGDGSYTVTLSAMNNCDTVVSTQTVVIVTPPSASFTASATSGCAPLTVQFTNTSSANSSTFNWQFPGGSPASSSAQNPSTTYSSAGTYTVTLTVSNAAGTSTATQTITVIAVPTAGFTFAVNGSTANFTNSSSNAASYAWNFGDGATSTATNPSHTYAGDGTYTVTLNATNACGTVTSTQTVVIVTPPSASFTMNASSGCAPLTVQFTNTSSANSSTFNWQFPGGNPSSSTAQNPSTTYSSAGTYTVTLTVSNAAGSSTATQTVTVNAAPSVAFNANTNVYVATFTNNTNNGTTYSWNFGDGSNSSETNPVHTYAGDGTFMVTLVATNGCGTATIQQQVVISSLPVANFTANTTSGCPTLEVQFQDQSSSNVTGWSWQFPGGTPSSSTAENPTVNYSTPGTYTVTLTVTNPLGSNTATQTNYITVATSPTAGFTSSTNLLTANFTNTSAGATSYSWNFGDNSPASTDANPSHTYATDGTYSVVLTATNACGSVTSTQSVTVVSMPVAGFTASPVAGCAPLAVNFTSTSSANSTTFNWQFPGGTPSSSTAENPSVTYSMPGTYSVTLTVNNAAGSNTATQTNLVVVNGLPTVSFNGTVNGTTVAFINNSGNATSYLWNFGDGTTSTEATPTHEYPGDGTYVVTLTATNECGSKTTEGQFTIVSPPTAGFSAPVTSGCAPFEVQFENESSENAVSFSWSFPGGNPATSTEENPVVTYQAPGTYSVSLTVTNTAGSDSYELTNYITVNSTPAAAFNYQATGTTVKFFNTSTNATSYLWDFGDGTTSTEAEPTHTYAGDDAYTVTLTATNDCGETVVIQLVVISVESPVAAFTAPATTGCAPFEVAFENLSSSNSTSFAWTFPGGNPATSSEENPHVTYSAAGVYDVTLIASNGVLSDTFTQVNYITVGSTPVALFSFAANQGEVAFTNNSSNAVSYTWDFGDGTTSDEANPTHTYAASGNYEVTLTAKNECGEAVNTQTVVVVITGIEDLALLSEFNVFPNPNGGRFTLSLKGQPQEKLEVSLTNVLGQRLHAEAMDFRSGQLRMEFSFVELPGGMYVFAVRTGERVVMRKIVVE